MLFQEFLPLYLPDHPLCLPHRMPQFPDKAAAKQKQHRASSRQSPAQQTVRTSHRTGDHQNACGKGKQHQSGKKQSSLLIVSRFRIRQQGLSPLS